MKIKKTVSIETLSRRTMLRPSDFSSRILLHDRILCSMRPSKWGWWEPTIHPWNLSSMESFIPPDRNGCADRVVWVRNGKLKAEGNFCVSEIPEDSGVQCMHAREWIHCELDSCPQISLIEYIKKSTVEFDCDIAFIHFIADEEKSIRHSETDFEGCFINTVDLSLISSTLRHWLPALPWAMVFGDAYVRLFGMDRLLSAPAYKVEKLSDDAVYIQLSPNLTDLQTDYEAVHAVRERVQDHLGRDAFFDVKKAYPLRGPIGEIPADQFLNVLAEFRPPEPGTNGFRVPEFRFIPDGLPLTTTTQIITQVAEFSEKYDDASWHYDGDHFSEHLPPEAGITHMAMFWAWAILAGLGKDGNLSADVREKMDSNSASPRTCFSQRNAEKFTDADLTEEGKAFTERYYEDDYIEDYVRTFADVASAYEVEDSWENLSKLTTILDRRLAEWKRQSQ